MNILSRLRILFIIYFIIKMAFDIILTAISSRELGNMGTYGIPGMNISPQMMMIFVVAVNAVLLIIGLLLFHNLMQRKNWVRIILIIIGWLAVVDFLSTLAMGSKSVKMLTGISGSVDWSMLIIGDIISDLIALIFWGYVIIKLQFTENVKQLFRPDSTADPQHV